MSPMGPDQEAIEPIEKRLTVPRILLLLLAVLLACYSGLRVFISSRMHKLEHMLAEVQSLKPGISRRDVAMRIAKEYSSEKTSHTRCSREKCSFEMQITWCDPTVNATSRLDNWFWRRVGIHCWDSWSWITVDERVVTSTGAGIAVESSDAWHEADWSLGEQIPEINENEEKQFLHNFNPERDETPTFLVDWTDFPHGNRAEILYVRMSTRANARQRQSGQNFNLECLTKSGDCSNVCELLPGAARYYNERLKARGWSLQGPRCGR